MSSAPPGSRPSLLAMLLAGISNWWLSDGVSWLGSVAVHVALIVSLVTFFHRPAPVAEGVAPSFEAAQFDTVIEPAAVPSPGVPVPLEPTLLNTESLSLEEGAMLALEEQINGPVGETFSEAGGGVIGGEGIAGIDRFEVMGSGPGTGSKGKETPAAKGTGNLAGSGGAMSGFGFRGTGQRKALLGGGATRASERAVAGALNWLARHQNADGSWSIDSYRDQCKDTSCVGAGHAKADVGATALGLLPFLASGQTHRAKGPYQRNLQNAVLWLLQHQDPRTGLIAAGGEGGVPMYSHGLATICLTEAYGMTGDSQIGRAAQGAIQYIEKAQIKRDGGWRYTPQDDAGDTSVVGWQVMALKSGSMAGLQVTAQTLENAKKFLKGASANDGSVFTYQIGGAPFPSMTAVGLLCAQYNQLPRSAPGMQKGIKYLMAHLPSTHRDVYYWYYATQVMHNLPGPQWDVWNRDMRKILIESQAQQGCARGSWDPAGLGITGDQGGRLAVTSLACLTLEVYYRYLPLYQLGEDDLDSVEQGGQ